METLDELRSLLTRFICEQTGDQHATVADVEVMPGHAGFSYGFKATYGGEAEARRSEDYVIRLPPRGVRFEGPADMLRQVRVLNALRESKVPVAPVRWSGDDPRWFGRPYFVVPRLDGDTLRVTRGEWGAALDAAALREMARQTLSALAALHAIDWRSALPEWGPPLAPEQDVVRWDRFCERTADPKLLEIAPVVRRRLLDAVPSMPRTGIFHGDFQWANLFFDRDRRLLAVIDWELAGIGPVLNDLGWIMVFSDPESWADSGRVAAAVPSPVELGAMYAEVSQIEPHDVRWYRALAAYKFAIIGGFNLMLHRRGKRHDPLWEELAPSVPRLLERASDVLDGV